MRLSDDRTFDAKGCVEGPEGRRRRVPGSLTSLPLDDSVLIALGNSDLALQWTKEGPIIPGGPAAGGPVPPPPTRPVPTQVEATQNDEVLKYAAERPLLRLLLTAATPAAAQALLGLAQPLGAETLSLSGNVSGELKDSGMINFAASGLKPTHPTKPLTVAQTLFNAMVEDATYEAVLALDFGPLGRTGLEAQLHTLTESVPEGISIRATFDKPVGGKS